MESQGIKHMVIFCLKHDKNSPETERFLQDGKDILSSIAQVQNFELLKQVSSKNEYDFGFSMEFIDNSSYLEYNSHPSHVNFVKGRWEKEVTKFLEIDFNKF